MNSFEIIKPGLLTTIQDFGRKGLAYYAIPISGVMDQRSAKIAQLLLNKSEDWPLIECTSIAPHLKFNAPTTIVISGADFSWKLNDHPLHLNTIIEIQKGDVLKGQFAKNGLRGYIGFNDELELDRVYNSFSTYMNASIGGYKGRLLKKGDSISWVPTKTIDHSFTLIPIKKGPEFKHLTNKAKSELVSRFYTINTDSNRMGIRLTGQKLESSIYQLEYSLPILPGFIQLPPSGLPIIILQDGQISGGYPRIAYIQKGQFSKLNQIPLGGKIRFEYC